MRIPKEFYIEDQKAKADKLLEIERSMQNKLSNEFYGKIGKDTVE